ESYGKEAGYEMGVKAEYAPGSKDFSSMILQAKSAVAEAVLGVPNPPDGMTIVKQMKELDFTPKFLMLLRGADRPAWATNLVPAAGHRLARCPQVPAGQGVERNLHPQAQSFGGSGRWTGLRGSTDFR